MAVPVVHTVCDRYGEAVSFVTSQANTKPDNGGPAISRSSTFPFSDNYQQCRGQYPRPSFSLGLGSLGAEQGRQIMVPWSLSSSQPWSQAPCPEFHVSVTTRSSNRLDHFSAPYSRMPLTFSLLLVIIYWYLWQTFCREVTLSQITVSNSDGQLVRIDLSISYGCWLSLQPRFSHVVTRVGFGSFHFCDKINPKNETFATYAIAKSRSLWINSLLTAPALNGQSGGTVLPLSMRASDAEQMLL